MRFWKKKNTEARVYLDVDPVSTLLEILGPAAPTHIDHRVGWVSTLLEILGELSRAVKRWDEEMFQPFLRFWSQLLKDVKCSTVCQVVSTLLEILGSSTAPTNAQQTSFNPS